MSKARTLADFISDGSEFADGTISVAEVSGAAPLASPTFTGLLTAPNATIEDTSDDNTQFTVKGGTQNLYIQSGAAHGGVLISSNQYVSQEYRTNENDIKFSFDNGTSHNVILDYSANTFRTNNIAAVFNETGLDKDFRVESDNQSNMLVVDAGNDAIGFGGGAIAGVITNTRNSSDVGDSAGNYKYLNRLHNDTSNNTNYLYTMHYRNTAGIDWTGSGMRIQRKIDSSWMGYVDFKSYGVSIGSGVDGTDPNGSNVTECMNFFDTAVTVNDGGNNQDFRVESDTNNTIFFVDAGANRIGIKNNTPTGADLNFDSVATNPTGDIPSGAKISFYGNNNDHLIGVDNEGSYHTTNTAWKVIAKSGSTYSGEMFTLNTSSEGAVFNDNSYNRNFRVESDSFSNAFIVDADTNLVGFADVGTAPWAQTSGQGVMTYRLTEGSMALSNNGTNGYAGLYINKFNASSDNRAISFYREGGTAGHIRLDATQGVKYGTTTNGGLTSTTELNKLGITFDGGSNYLDDYEEGTWDARPSTSSSSVVPLSGWNINAYSGSYVKIGRLVICQFYFDWTNTNTNSGTVYLKLPFQVNGTTNQWSGNGIETSQVSFPSGATQITVRPENVQAHATFKGCGNQLSRVDMQFNHLGGYGAGYTLGSFVYMTTA